VTIQIISILIFDYSQHWISCVIYTTLHSFYLTVWLKEPKFSFFEETNSPVFFKELLHLWYRTLC
jgi:hypothetical protein